MQKKILVVEDEPDLRAILAEELGAWEIHQAGNGQEGFEQAMLLKPDVILTDVNMPVMDGLSMVEALRLKNIHVPCIVMTAFSDKGKISKAWKLGAFDFLEKPVQFDQLISVIKNALEFGTRPQFNQRLKEVRLTFDLLAYERLKQLAGDVSLEDWMMKILRERFL